MRHLGGFMRFASHWANIMLVQQPLCWTWVCMSQLKREHRKQGSKKQASKREGRQRTAFAIHFRLIPRSRPHGTSRRVMHANGLNTYSHENNTPLSRHTLGHSGKKCPYHLKGYWHQSASMSKEAGQPVRVAEWAARNFHMQRRPSDFSCSELSVHLGKRTTLGHF